MTVEQCWQLNTSNPGKLEEFRRLFAKYGWTIQATQHDLPEIDADPLTVITHKASLAGDNILVDDTILDVEGAALGIHVKWLLEHLSSCMDRKALWKTFLAYRRKQEVYIYCGEVVGTIVSPRGQKTGGFGFDPFFLPQGRTETVAENKSDDVNARALAVEALVFKRVLCVRPIIEDWKGPWQGI